MSTLLVDALRVQSITHLRQCFRTYDLISGLPEAIEVINSELQAFCKQVRTPTSFLRPKLIAQTIIAPSPNDPQSPVVPETPSAKGDVYDKIRLKPSGPVTDVLNRVLEHVYDLRPLIVSADEVDLDVLSRILWPAISTSIVSSLGNTIFAAGRPDELHQVSYTSQGPICRENWLTLSTIRPYTASCRPWNPWHLRTRPSMPCAKAPNTPLLSGGGSSPFISNSDGRKLSERTKPPLLPPHPSRGGHYLNQEQLGTLGQSAGVQMSLYQN